MPTYFKKLTCPNCNTSWVEELQGFTTKKPYVPPKKAENSEVNMDDVIKEVDTIIKKHNGEETSCK